MTWNRATAIILGGFLVASVAYGGEDKPLQKGQDKEKPAAAQPVQEQKAMDVDAFIKKFDHNLDGFLEKHELPLALRGCFNDMDDNKDGKLSREELQKHRELLQNWQAMTERRQERLTFLGALVTHFARSEDPGREVVQGAYDILQRIDANQDGKIDSEEWEAAKQRLCEMRVDALLERQGAKDGKLSKDKTFGRARRHFDQWDLNHDGVLDRDELIQAFGGKVHAAKPNTETKPNVKPAAPRENP